MEEKNTEQVQLSPVPGKKKRGKKRKTIRRIILALILVVILGGAAWLGIMSLRQEYTVTYDEYSAAQGQEKNFIKASAKKVIIGGALGAVIGLGIWFLAGLAAEWAGGRKEEEDRKEAAV